MSLLTGILSVLTGGVSNLFMKKGLLGRILNNAGDTAADLGQQNMLGNYVAKQTGSRLTDAEREANRFADDQARLAWEREMEASNTAKQRQVQDYIAAGINPMFAAGTAVQLPAASAATSVSPSAGAFNLPALLDLYNSFRLTKAEVAVKAATKRNIDADTNLKQSQVTAQDFTNRVNEVTEQVQIEERKLNNDALRENIARIRKEQHYLSVQAMKSSEEAKTEAYKRAQLEASAILQHASAWQIRTLTQYDAALKSAQTDQARASAALASVQYMYQQGLIDGGYVDSLCQQAASEAGIKLSAEELANIKAAIRTGDYSRCNLPADAFSTNGILSVIASLLDNFNPLAGLVK